MKPSCLAVVLAVVGAVAPMVAAEEYPAPPHLKLPAGLRVRVQTWSLPGQTIEGTLLSADSGTVKLVPRTQNPLVGGDMALPVADVTRMDVRMGRKSHWWQGALVGLAIGLVAGFADDVDPVLCQVDDEVLCSRGEALAVFGFTMTGLGAGVGALVKTDQWTPVALDTLGPPPREARGPFSFKLTFRF